MKKLNILQSLISAVFIVFIIIIGYNLYQSPIKILMGLDLSQLGMGFPEEGNTSFVKLLAFVKIVIVLMFVLAVFYLKLSLKYFIEKEYFVGKIDMYFKWSGFLFLIIGISSLLFQLLITELVKHTIIDFSFGLELIQTPFYDRVFMIFIGLFFIFISKAFFQAKELKQENTLTI